MDMHAAAGEIGVGLGHEGHKLAVLGGDAAQQTFEQNRFINRAQRIVTTPAYMYDARPKDVCAGIRRMCTEVAALAGAGGAR